MSDTTFDAASRYSLEAHYSLDETLPARITQAVGAGLFIAVSDYIKSKPLRWFAKSTIAAGTFSLVALFNSIDEDPDNDPAVLIDLVKRRVGDIGFTDGPESEASEGDFGSPAQTWAIIGTGAALVVAGTKVLSATDRWLAKGLRAVKVKRPYTVMGAVTAAATFASLPRA